MSLQCEPTHRWRRENEEDGEGGWWCLLAWRGGEGSMSLEGRFLWPSFVPRRLDLGQV